MGYLFFTNSTIATLANWWTKVGEEGKKALAYDITDDQAWVDNKWLRAFNPTGRLSLGCCCCLWSQQWLYGHHDMVQLVKTVEDSRKSAEQLYEERREKAFEEHKATYFKKYAQGGIDVPLLGYDG